MSLARGRRVPEGSEGEGRQWSEKEEERKRCKSSVDARRVTTKTNPVVCSAGIRYNTMISAGFCHLPQSSCTTLGNFKSSNLSI